MGDVVGDVVRPSGVVTFLFSDIEGSTRRWEADPDGMRAALATHDEVLRSAIEANGGWLFKHTGDGACAAFESPGAAVGAAVEAQRDLALPVRMGIATGETELRSDDYFGPALNRAARVMDAGHGGQVLVASVTASLVDDVELLDLGTRNLRDLSEPVGLFQVCADGLALDFPPLRTLDATPGNLRPLQTSFVGRERELAEVTDAVRTHRLVSLTGVGGVGKTRLAFQAAADLSPEFPEGVWVIELASVGDPTAVPDAVAAVLGINPQPGMTVTESVATALAGRQRLLLFDNCEHVLEAAADLIEGILDQSETVRVLTTSREGLGLPIEHLWPVPSLDADVACVALFLDRARTLVPEFSIADPEDAQAVSEIGRRLDGIPLAIELAASRTVSMSPGEVRDRMDDRFRLLTGSRRGLERHQTLRNAVHWSYDLLGPDEQGLLNTCSVFLGGFDLDAAVAVAGDGLDDYAVLDLLDSLVRKSLVNADRSGGTTRYSMLETIRQFAEAQLAETGQSAETRNAHAAYFAEQIVRLYDLLSGPRPSQAVKWLESDFANLRSAFRWSADQGDLDTAAMLAMYAAYVSAGTGDIEPEAWMEELLEPAERADHPRLACLFVGAANLCYRTGRLDEFVSYAESAEALFNDPRYERFPDGLGASMCFAGYMYVGRADKSLELCRADLAVLGDPPLAVRVGLVSSLTVVGNIEEALAESADLYELASNEPNPWRAANGFVGYALPRSQTEPLKALDANRRALALARESHNKFMQPFAMLTVARLEMTHGDKTTALRLLGEGVQAQHDSGDIQPMRSSLALVVAMLDDLGHLEAAATIAGYAGDVHRLSFFSEFTAATGHLRTELGDDEYESLAREGEAMNAASITRFTLEQLRQALSPARREAEKTIGLTGRQLEVARLVARGLSNKEIAKRLDISPYTVETHVRNILERLDATNRTQIVAWVMANDQPPSDTAL